MHRFGCVSLAFLVAVGISIGARTSGATTVTYTVGAFEPSGSISLTGVSGGNLGAGSYNFSNVRGGPWTLHITATTDPRLTPVPQDVIAFCVDLAHNLASNTVQVVDLAGGGAYDFYQSGTHAGKVGGLIAEYQAYRMAGSINTGSALWTHAADIGAAFQIAIWKQIYNITSYSASGITSHGHTQTQFRALVNYLIDNAGFEDILQFHDTTSPYSQDQAILAPARSVPPVPGPLAGAGLPGLLAACAGLLILARRRRNRLA